MKKFVFLLIIFCLLLPGCAKQDSGNMALVKGGTFLMGSPENEPERRWWDEHQVRVRVSSFYIGRYPVTQDKYEEIMGINPSGFIGGNLPVENVSWFDAIEYCNKLSLKEGLTPVYTMSNPGYDLDIIWDRKANGYRLPTEAEWEFACRAGTKTPFNTGNNLTTDQANFSSEDLFRETTTPVGTFAPNSLGLFDMHGNIWEWCWDWYDEYPAKMKANPIGAEFSGFRVTRGGCWLNPEHFLRSAARDAFRPWTASSHRGFRVARNR